MERRPSSSRAFFLELVLDMVIFVICAVICLQVFAQARVESARSAAQTQLGIEAQQLAEYFKAGHSDLDSLLSVMSNTPEGAIRCLNDGDPKVERAGSTAYSLTWYFDQELQPVDTETAGAAVYILTCAVDTSQLVKTATITLMEGRRTLLQYEVSRYNIGSNLMWGGDG
ncbi:MAG: hypothetical protein FWF91_07595 [Coriobacteriia bacterium]|nr:hypothetical protein [Coriobacteriia bacterium]